MLRVELDVGLRSSEFKPWPALVVLLGDDVIKRLSHINRKYVIGESSGSFTVNHTSEEL